MTPPEAVEFLNSLLKEDPAAISYLLDYRVSINEKLQEHPFVMATTGRTLGILGLLNGMLCRGSERIQAVYDNDTHTLLSFKVGQGYTQL